MRPGHGWRLPTCLSRRPRSWGSLADPENPWFVVVEEAPVSRRPQGQPLLLCRVPGTCRVSTKSSRKRTGATGVAVDIFSLLAQTVRWSGGVPRVDAGVGRRRQRSVPASRGIGTSTRALITRHAESLVMSCQSLHRGTVAAVPALFKGARGRRGQDGVKSRNRGYARPTVFCAQRRQHKAVPIGGGMESRLEGALRTSRQSYLGGNNCLRLSRTVRMRIGEHPGKHGSMIFAPFSSSHGGPFAFVHHSSWAVQRWN